MFHVRAQSSGIRRALAFGVLALGAALLPAIGPRALAQNRLADAAPPTPVAYHLSILIHQGPAAGSSIEGQVGGPGHSP